MFGDKLHSNAFQKLISYQFTCFHSQKSCVVGKYCLISSTLDEQGEICECGNVFHRFSFQYTFSDFVFEFSMWYTKYVLSAIFGLFLKVLPQDCTSSSTVIQEYGQNFKHHRTINRSLNLMSLLL